ncbi:MAG TPA: F0F1 ATP synthase subunit epsilon [Gammaproteobacteria bacterium]|nr:F0F1 ATP synthase subunit epsilon [Gammaproteobacteria bacterium]
MAASFHIDIVSAEEQIFAGTAEMVFAPAEEGEIGIAARHAPLLTRLVPGTIRVQPGGNAEELVFFVSGGVLEIQPHVVTVLSDTAQRARDIDEAAAQEAKRRAEEALARRDADMDIARAQAELAEAIARLRALEQLRRTMARRG